MRWSRQVVAAEIVDDDVELVESDDYKQKYPDYKVEVELQDTDTGVNKDFIGGFIFNSSEADTSQVIELSYLIFILIWKSDISR